MRKLIGLPKALIILVLAMVLVGTVSCSSSSPSATTSPASTGPNPGLTTNPASNPGTSSSGIPVTINISAKNMAFDTASISVPAGAAVILVFTNNDGNVPHNIGVYFDSTGAKSIFIGETILGVASVTYKFTAPSSPGNYYFRCDIHPKTMTGTFTVTPNTQ